MLLRKKWKKVYAGPELKWYTNLDGKNLDFLAHYKTIDHRNPSLVH